MDFKQTINELEKLIEELNYCLATHAETGNYFDSDDKRIKFEQTVEYSKNVLKFVNELQQ